MKLRINWICIWGIFSLLILFVIIALRLLGDGFKPEERAAILRLKEVHEYPRLELLTSGSDDGDSEFNSLPEKTLRLLEEVLEFQRLRLREELFKFSDDRGVFRGSNLSLENGGQPVRSLIVSTWRSGSTFLGQILNSVPGSFHHEEPLIEYDINQIRRPSHVKIALNYIKQLFNCNYTGLEYMLDSSHSTTYFSFRLNKRLWPYCKLYMNFCLDPKLMEPFCKLFPVQNMKIVRLRASLLTPLLEDTSLNLRIILLIRDPRGILGSRKHVSWCDNHPDCYYPPIVCNDLLQNYNAAVELKRRFPSRFT
ncbi:carbohydrate sulfotransferase 5-like [Uranotaenia lowii]|uniref:carbohydrate sulfotransferase 5-like n=1 Tax=Uranotaenia lowii TaxID=190385 RepID=UPI002478FCB9|nr:carbohydrate sulfotransferase 5-like [Uranotaenia lowii]